MRGNRGSINMLALVLAIAVLAATFASCSSGGGGGGGVVYDNSRATGMYTFVVLIGGANAQVGTLTFNGAGTATYSILQSSVATSATGTLSYTVTHDNTITIDGTMVGALRSGGSFFVAADTTNSNEALIYGVKHSALVTDQTATYRAGRFALLDGTSPVQLVEISMATPTTGALFFSQLQPAGGPTGTGTYTLNTANGTISLPSVTPTEYGAITSDRQLLIAGDGDDGDGILFGLCGLKLAGSGMSKASLNGTYLINEFMRENGGYITSRTRATFDGSGNGTYTGLVISNGSLLSSGTFTYDVNPDGTFVVGGMAGVALSDGSVFQFLDSDYGAGGNPASVKIGVKQ